MAPPQAGDISKCDILNDGGLFYCICLKDIPNLGLKNIARLTSNIEVNSDC